MKKLLLVLLFFIFAGCTIFQRQTGHVVFRDGNKYEFKNATVSMDSENLYVVEDEVQMIIPHEKIKERVIKNMSDL